MRTRRYACLIILFMLFFAGISVRAYATTKTFGAGSWIIPMGPCWQPNNALSAPYTTGCDTDQNDKGLFQAQGMLYALLDTGDDPQNCTNNDGSIPFQKRILGYCKSIPVYWMIKKDKANPDDIDLSIAGDGTGAVVNIYNSSALTDSGTVDPVNYLGGPFVIDANDITDQEMQEFMNTYPDVKIHRSNFAFSGNVEKILVGRPPKVAVLNEGAITVLRDYLRASGLFNWENYVFVQLDARDVIAGCLQDPIPASCTARRTDITTPFQLVWAPHWIVEDKWADGSTPTLTDQHNVVQEVRDFLEKGNAGFFECASIESFEGSQDVSNPSKSAGNDYDQPNDMSNSNIGGFLLSRTNNVPRIDTNGGCSDTGGCGSNYKVFEDPSFWLAQCGGWEYAATGGHVHNMRPNESSGYKYLSTLLTDDPNTPQDDRFVGTSLTRFVHDDPTKVDYSPSSDYYVYDYLVGGRINGSPTQGYIIYFPGHKYIKCQNTGTAGFPERILKLQFDAPLDPNSTVSLELVHPYCSSGSCPKATFSLASGDGSSSVDSYAYVDMDSASYDPTTYTLNDVIIGNKTPGSMKVVDLMVEFPGNSGPPAVNLTDIQDVSDSSNNFTVCSPNSPSPASCSGAGITTDNITFTFSGPDLSTVDPNNKDVTIEILHSSCNQGYDCPKATFNLSSGTQTSSTADGSNMIYLDVSSASYSYDSGTQTGTLSGVKLGNIEASCSDVTIDDIYVDFPGTATLTSVDNTSKSQNICAPNMQSQARCSGSPSPPSTGCPEGEFQIGGSKISDDDGVLKVDMSNARFSGDAKKLDKITLKNIGCNRMDITEMRIEFPDGSSTLNKFKKAKEGGNTVCDPNPDVDDSPAMCTPSSPYNIGNLNSKKDIKLEFANPHNNSGVVKVQVAYQCDDGSSCTISGGGGSSWSYTLSSGLNCSFNYNLDPFISYCDIDWSKSNTCGIKYILNTLLALKYQVVTSEFAKTQAVVKDNIMYKASYDYPTYRGHLKMIKVPTDTQSTAVEVWDAADTVPDAGVSGFPTAPEQDHTNNSNLRYIFTRDPSTGNIIRFDPTNKATLQSVLGASTATEAEILINTVRGRDKASLTDPDGTGEMNDKLWAIENSTPALMVGSNLVSGGATRDRIIFAGADDGMLHAFWGGSWDSNQQKYTDGDGEELWAFIPYSLLPYLKNQPFDPDPEDYSTFEPAVSVDGSPALGDFLVDPDGDGVYEWRTYLVETAMVKNLNKGIIFALDVTNPYNPSVLWEYTYADTSVDKCGDDGGTNEKNCNMGNSKGVAVGRVQVGTKIQSVVFLTSSWIDKKNPQDYTQDCNSNPSGCVYGVSVYAVDLLNGDILWEKKLPYTGDATNVNDTPAIPSLMDIDNNGTHDFVVFGDFQGRLWAMRTTDGSSIAGTDASGNELPVFEVQGIDQTGQLDGNPVGAAEPIGASVSIYKNVVVFGTGGADYASDSAYYHVFTIAIHPGGGYDVINIYTTDAGEKVWAKPVIDRHLNVFIATARNYYSQVSDVSQLQSEGRITIIGLKTGTVTHIKDSTNNEWFQGGFVGGIDLDNKHAYAVTFSASGTPQNAIQIGSATDFTPTESTENPFKVLWWKKF